MSELANNCLNLRLFYFNRQKHSVTFFRLRTHAHSLIFDKHKQLQLHGPSKQWRSRVSRIGGRTSIFSGKTSSTSKKDRHWVLRTFDHSASPTFLKGFTKIPRPVPARIGGQAPTRYYVNATKSVLKEFYCTNISPLSSSSLSSSSPPSSSAQSPFTVSTDSALYFVIDDFQSPPYL